jgi:O-antigen ligase
MNPARLSNSHKNGIVAAIGVLVLLIGTATGNAYLMLAMAIVALLVCAILLRQRLRRNVLLAVFAAAAIGAVVVVAFTKL